LKAWCAPAGVLAVVVVVVATSEALVVKMERRQEGMR
jgi:hypothetical protein